MVILVLIFWSVVGLFMMAQLYDGGYLENISSKTAGIISLICGPITCAAFVAGILIGIIRIIIEELEDNEE